MSDIFPKSSTLGKGFEGQIQLRKGLILVTTLSSQEGCSWRDYFALDGLILSCQPQSTSVMFSMLRNGLGQHGNVHIKTAIFWDYCSIALNVLFKCNIGYIFLIPLNADVICTFRANLPSFQPDFAQVMDTK